MKVTEASKRIERHEVLVYQGRERWNSRAAKAEREKARVATRAQLAEAKAAGAAERKAKNEA